mgnify:FL=1
MGDESKADQLLRRTFGHTTPMQPDERVMQAPKAFSREEMLEAGIPESLHSMVTWFDSLEEAKRELGDSGAKPNK